MKAITDFSHYGWHIDRRTFEIKYRVNGRVISTRTIEWLIALQDAPESIRNDALREMIFLVN